jgi:KaiC/GvpD/RAD55 family RecA-like ATPase
VVTVATDRRPTGIDELDRKLGGGVPPGGIVALTAPPVSQSELFLYEVATAGSTVYLTTERSVATVRTVLDEAAADGIDADVTGVDDVADAAEAVADLPSASTVIVDPVAPLERGDGDDYLQFLNRLKARLRETDSTALLHCLDRRTVPPTRDTTEYVADIVFELTTEVHGDALENYLTVPKFRGGSALEERIKLHLATDVTIDITRTIA